MNTGELVIFMSMADECNEKNVQSIMSTRQRKTYISTTSSTSLLSTSRPRAEAGASSIASWMCEYRGVILSSCSEIVVVMYGEVRCLLVTTYATV